MAPKRKAPPTPIADSPSKRVTRSKSLVPVISVPKTSPRKSRVAKQLEPELKLGSSEESGDELDLFHQVPATPSKKSKIFPVAKSVKFVDAQRQRHRQLSPSKITRNAANISPRKNTQLKTPSLTPPPADYPQPSSSHPVSKDTLPQDMLSCQKRAVLYALQHPLLTVSDDDDEEPSTNEIAIEQLGALLDGTVNRGEGNSCLLLGPRGSGKTLSIESCIANLSQTPIVVRLSGWVQTNDRLAMKELSRQLSSQVSPALLPEELRSTINGDTAEDDENPFLDTPSEVVELSVPTAHMHSLVACIPTLGRATIIVLDAFDLFAEHPRQSLLYSLLDTVQSCRAGGTNHGLAVVGITTRMDSLTMLEKRVKSRFSGRMIRTSASNTATKWKNVVRRMLMPVVDEASEEFNAIWKQSVDGFLEDAKTIRILEEACSIAGDVRSLSRLFISPVLNLKPTSPWLTASQLELSVESQRVRPEYPYLYTLNYPSLCLLLASYQAENDGYSSLTFEMLHEYVRNAIRVSYAAPVQLNGGSIGMKRISRPVLWATFEQLKSAQIFVALTGPSVNVGKNFLKYRCCVDRENVRKSVEKNGDTNLRQFLRRAMP